MWLNGKAVLISTKIGSTPIFSTVRLAGFKSLPFALFFLRNGVT